MKKQRLMVLIALICLVALLLPVTVFADQSGWVQDGNYWYYYDEQGNPASDCLEIDGVEYYFYGDGRMVADAAFYSYKGEKWVVVSEDGKSNKTLTNGWTQAFGEWYYLEDNQLARYTIKKIGGKLYGFDAEGCMLDAEANWTEFGLCRAKAGGELYAGAWYQEGEEWYYYTEDGAPARDFVKVSNVWYYFWYDGRMAKDTAVYSEVDKEWVALSEDGERYQKLKKGWNLAFGEWYYLEENADYPSGLALASDGFCTIDGNDYYFMGNGQMAANEVIEYYDYDNHKWVVRVAGANGVLTDTGWYEYDGDWHYIRNGQELNSGVYEIDGNYYGFAWDGSLYDVGGEQNIDVDTGDYWYSAEFYVTNGSGVLYRNRWRYREITEEYEIGWVYYGDDAQMVTGQSMKIGGKWYAFDYNGVMITSDIYADGNGIFLIDSNGVGKKLPAKTWRQYDGAWYYTAEDGSAAEGVMNVGGVTYCFSEGRMMENEVAYVEIADIYGCYLFGDNGALVTTRGWVKVNDYYWYFVKEDGTLQTGWLFNGGQWYYMEPQMVYDSLFYDYDEQKSYYANGKGICTAVSGNGLTWVNGSLYYFEGGKAVTKTWKQVGGSWYYFRESGSACKNGEYSVEDTRYCFDADGKMRTGWIYNWGTWYYADASGKLVSGVKTIDGKKYCFSDYGYLLTSCVYDKYLVDENGVVLATAAGTGWKSVNGNWYYSQDGHWLESGVVEIGGKYYGFKEGVMLSGGVKEIWGDWFYFTSGGEIATGWHKVNGQWVYASDDSYPNLAVDYSEYINGKEYVFDENGYLLIGSFTRYGWVYVTDADGAVIKSERVADGWVHYDNNWYYTVDGNGYDGWLGDYFLDDGLMLYAEILEYNGKLYYLKSDGLCLRNGWAKTWNGWILARADGSLYCSTWAQVGGKWYYFDGRYMVNYITMIDGKYHDFDENGVWLGEYKFTSSNGKIDAPKGLEDGTWYKNTKTDKWYYYHGGYPVTGNYYINGNYYFFSYTTAEMITNNFGVYEYNGYTHLESRYYYGDDGAAVKYTGWQQIGGEWYFFGDDNRFRTGLLKDSSGYYYAYWDEETGYEMLKNNWVIDEGKLYVFNSSGFAKKAVSANGWYSACGDWFYFSNGRLVDGYREIGGVGYMFSEGYMMTDWIGYVDGHYRYFGTNGAMVTKQGWHQIHGGDEWIYIGQNGEMYTYGIYKIANQYYAFADGLWLQ